MPRVGFTSPPAVCRRGHRARAGRLRRPLMARHQHDAFLALFMAWRAMARAYRDIFTSPLFLLYAISTYAVGTHRHCLRRAISQRGRASSRKLNTHSSPGLDGPFFRLAGQGKNSSHSSYCRAGIAGDWQTRASRKRNGRRRSPAPASLERRGIDDFATARLSRASRPMNCQAKYLGIAFD